MDKPALRISNIVTGRRTNGSRVSYLLAPDGSGHQRATPETVVLRRWRQRKLVGHVFSGTRLSPTIWRAMSFTFPDLHRWVATPSLEEIEERIAATLIARKFQYLSLPSAVTLRALQLDLGLARLRQLIDRHMSDSHRGKSGVPDLYLFARTDLSLDAPTFSRFVEVKKPKEPVSKAQKEEIAFMQSLGLQARVLRLIEREVV